MENNYNRIRQWLVPILHAKGMSVNDLAVQISIQYPHTPITRAAIYNYFDDKRRPDEQTMLRICNIVGVPVTEGLRQYTPKQNGRPRGSSNN